MKDQGGKLPLGQDEILLASCLYCRVRKKSLCTGCDLAELRNISQLKKRREYAAGEMIFNPGEVAAFTGIVVEGTVAVCHPLPNGDERVVKLLTDGAMFGHMRDYALPCGFRAETNVAICTFDQDVFSDELRKIPAIDAHLQDILVKEIDASREMIAWLSGPDARQKLALYLVYLCEQVAAVGGDGPIDIVFPATQGTIANYLGVTRWSMSREMSWLRNQKIIQSTSHRTLTVHSLDKLRQIASVARGGDR
jgi:CRP-like cAMP-binding protein